MPNEVCTAGGGGVKEAFVLHKPHRKGWGDLSSRAELSFLA